MKYFVSYVWYGQRMAWFNEDVRYSGSHGFGQTVIESDGPLATQGDFDKLAEHVARLLRENEHVSDPSVILLNVQRCPI